MYHPVVPKRVTERRNLSFPKGLIKDVRSVLQPNETLSGVVTSYLLGLVSRRSK